MYALTRWCVFSLAWVVTAVPARGGTLDVPPGDPVRPARFSRPPTIDGRIDADEWAAAPLLTGFREIHPGDNVPASQETEVRIGYDRRALYLAFRAHDRSKQVRATVARRDAIASDDTVGVYLDTFNDRRRAYYLFFNPYGVQADGIFTEGQTDPDLTVDLVVDSKGTVDADGYTVEAAIPFASLRFEPGGSHVWGLHVQRFIRRDRNEQISWMPVSRDRSSLLDQAGQLTGLDGAGVSRPLEIVPTVVATQTGNSTRGTIREGPVSIEPGVTATVGLTPTLNGVFTANPDFAQVEADQLVLDVNQRFPIFYDEKRPFFLEGVDAFQTPIAIVHTRTIVDPVVAAKLSGKLGRTTVGVLFATDPAAKAVVRVKRDVGRESTIGAAMTSFHEGAARSDLLSGDVRLRLTDRTVLTGQLAGSVARMPFRDLEGSDRTLRDGAGLTYHARIERRTRHTFSAITAAGASPDYRADLGFVRRVNINSVNVNTTYNAEPRPTARLITWSATNISHVQWDWQGRANLVYVYPQAEIKFRRNTYVRALAFRDYERLFEEEFGPRRAPGRPGAFAGDSERSTSYEGVILQAGSAPSEALAFEVTLSRTWDFFDFDFGAGPKFPRVSPAALADPAAPLDPGPARARGIGGEVTWRPADALNTSLEISRNTLVRNDTGRTAYDATLVSWRGTYQFTRFAFVRLRTDWNSVQTSLLGQYLFGWTPNPGTAIYAGVTDAATINPLDPVTGAHRSGYQRGERTVFVKLSYLFRRVF